MRCNLEHRFGSSSAGRRIMARLYAYAAATLKLLKWRWESEEGWRFVVFGLADCLRRDLGRLT